MPTQALRALYDARPSKGPVPTFAETYGVMADQARYVDTLQAVSRTALQYEQEALDNYAQITGDSSLSATAAVDTEGELSDDFAMTQLWAWLEKNPQYKDDPKFDLDFTRRAEEQALITDAKTREVLGRVTTAGGYAGMAVGGIRGAFESPLFLATLPIGATAGMSFRAGVITEMAVGGLSEGAEQLIVQQERAKLGLEASTEAALRDAAFAAAGGGIFYGGLRGLGVAFKHLRGKAARDLPDAPDAPDAPDLPEGRRVGRDTFADFSDAPPEVVDAYHVWTRMYEAPLMQTDALDMAPMPKTYGKMQEPLTGGTRRFAASYLKQVDTAYAKLLNDEPYGPFYIDPKQFDPSAVNMPLVRVYTFGKIDGRDFVPDNYRGMYEETHNYLETVMKAQAAKDQRLAMVKRRKLAERERARAREVRKAAYEAVAQSPETLVDLRRSLRELGEGEIPTNLKVLRPLVGQSKDQFEDVLQRLDAPALRAAERTRLRQEAGALLGQDSEFQLMVRDITEGFDRPLPPAPDDVDDLGVSGDVLFNHVNDTHSKAMEAFKQRTGQYGQITPSPRQAARIKYAERAVAETPPERAPKVAEDQHKVDMEVIRRAAQAQTAAEDVARGSPEAKVLGDMELVLDEDTRLKLSDMVDHFAAKQDEIKAIEGCLNVGRSV